MFSPSLFKLLVQRPGRRTHGASLPRSREDAGARVASQKRYQRQDAVSRSGCYGGQGDPQRATCPPAGRLGPVPRRSPGRGSTASPRPCELATPRGASRSQSPGRMRLADKTPSERLASRVTTPVSGTSGSRSPPEEERSTALPVNGTPASRSESGREPDPSRI